MTPPEEPVKPLGVECLQCENQTKHLCNDCGVCLLCCDCDCDDYDDLEDKEGDNDNDTA